MRSSSFRHAAVAAALTASLSAATAAPANAAPARGAADACAAHDGQTVLATTAQLELERRAAEVMAQPAMQAAIERVEAAYRADAQAATPSGAATLARAARSIALAAVQYVVNGDGTNPNPMWVVNAPHDWFGLSVGGSGYGIDNPDNVYRNIPIDGGGRYLICGQVLQPAPIEQHFTLMDAIPGTTAIAAEGGGFIGTLRSDTMDIGPDGRFVISIDSDPANGRPNHIQTPKHGQFLLIVRDLLTRWETQKPVLLTAKRLDGTPGPRPEPGKQAEDAAALLDRIAPYWIEYDNRYIYSRPVNRFVSPRMRPGGRGMAATTHFSLGEDEALVLRLDPLGGTSLGVQLTDPWGVAYDYVNRTSSLNQTQAHVEPDGTIFYVISARDPGVRNWLDPEGFSGGIVTIRWQGLPAGADAAKGVREVRTVPLADLRTALPAGTPRLTPDERRMQRADRARAHASRMLTQLPAGAADAALR